LTRRSFFSDYIFNEKKILGKYRPTDLDSFKFVLVMPEPGRSLDSIIRYECPSDDMVDEIVVEIVECLKIFHSKGIELWNLEPSDIFRCSSRMKLIHIAQACKLDFSTIQKKFESITIGNSEKLSDTQIEELKNLWRGEIAKIKSPEARRISP